MKKLLSLLLVCMLVVSVAGCGKKTPTEPAEILKQTQEKAQNVKSVEGTMTVDVDAKFEMGEQTQDIKAALTMDMASFVDPLKAKVDMTIDLTTLGLGKQEIAVYVAKEEEDYYTYMQMAGEWTKIKLEKEQIESALKQASAEGNTDLYSKNADSFTNKGEVDLDGKKAIQLEGSIKGESIKTIIEETDALDEADTYKDMITPYFEDLKDIPVTMFVDVDTMQTTKATMDMKDFLQGIIDKAIEQLAPMLTGAEAGASDMKVTLNKCDVAITYKNFDNATDFEVPEEAKNATEVDSSAMDSLTGTTDEDVNGDITDGVDEKVTE